MRHSTADERPISYWFARHSKSIIFLICILDGRRRLRGADAAGRRVSDDELSAHHHRVDNGVMPIEQMEVSITRPIEDAVRSVPGIEDVRSITSRGSAEIDLFFDWNVDMLETLQLVDAAVSSVQSTCRRPRRSRRIACDFASFPIIGYSLTSDTVPQTDLWDLATYDIKPRLNALPGVASVLIQGGQRPEFHVTVDPAQMLRAKTGDRRHRRRDQPHQRRRLAGPADAQSSVVSRR